MGTVNSRRAGGSKHLKNLVKPSGEEAKAKSNNSGYFILCIKGGDRVKVVNASDLVLKHLGAVIKRHFAVSRSGWDRHLAYSYRLQTNGTTSKPELISMTAEVLLLLYRSGWEPMTPVDLCVKGKTMQNQTAICFRRETPESELHLKYNSSGQYWNLDTSFSTSFEDIMEMEHKECFCLETYGRNILGFHDVPNTLLMELVQCVQAEWSPGVASMSNAVSSVISDYATGLDEVQTEHNVDDRRYVRLHKSPWSQLEEGADPEEAAHAENLVISIVACLARVQYKLQISIQMSASTTVFFFIHDSGCHNVRLPTFCGVGVGEKDGLYVYRPTVVRTMTSFFRSRKRKGKDKSGKSIRQRIKNSFRRKSTRRSRKASSTAVAAAAAIANPGGLSTQDVEEAAEEIKLARTPTVKFNKGLRKLLATSDTEDEGDQERDQGQQMQQQQQQQQQQPPRPQAGSGSGTRRQQRKAGISIRISDEDGIQRKAEEADLEIG